MDNRRAKEGGHGFVTIHHDKAAHKTIRVDNPNWMEVDIHG